MIKSIILTSLLISLMTGCVSTSSYNQSNYNQIKRTVFGKIISIKEVVIEDNGVGLLGGALLGGLLGNQFGGGKGNTAMTIVGAGAGAYTGNKLNTSNGQKLTIKLLNGEIITTVRKGGSLRRGDKIELQMIDGKIESLKRY